MSTTTPNTIDPARREARRHQLSEKFIIGSGVEIGALHRPLWISDRASVKYVDRMPMEKLREHYPDLPAEGLTRVDIIDDGETLAKTTDLSLDFVVANHMLEHCQNPLGTLRNHYRKLRPGGVLYYAVPDKRFTFDVDRPLTPFEHLIHDDQQGPEGSRWDHFLEYATLVHHLSGPAAQKAAQQLSDQDYSIHFHVWNLSSFQDFVPRALDYLSLACKTEHLDLNEDEIILILRRS